MNEQAKKLERDAVLCSLWKHKELRRNDVVPSFRRSNNLDNNDPCINSYSNVQVKSLLIDLEAYSESQGDKAQATLQCAA